MGHLICSHSLRWASWFILRRYRQLGLLLHTSVVTAVIMVLPAAEIDDERAASRVYPKAGGLPAPTIWTAVPIVDEDSWTSLATTVLFTMTVNLAFSWNILWLHGASWIEHVLTCGDHRVPEHSAAELTTVLHQQLLSKLQWLWLLFVLGHIRGRAVGHIRGSPHIRGLGQAGLRVTGDGRVRALQDADGGMLSFWSYGE